MVIVILGILAVVAVPRFTGGTAYEARGYYDELKAAARYAQLQASTTACWARFRVDASGYALHHDDSCTSGDFNLPVIHPSRGGDFANSTPDGVAVNVTVANEVVFNGLGAPRSNTLPQVSVTGGGFNQSFCIRAETGFVEDC